MVIFFPHIIGVFDPTAFASVQSSYPSLGAWSRACEWREQRFRIPFYYRRKARNALAQTAEKSGKFNFPAEVGVMSADDSEKNEFRRTRAEKISKALMAKSWTRTKLAQQTGYDVRTIRTVLAGLPVRDQTIVDISQALGIDAELQSGGSEIEVSEPWYGSYAREPYRAYEGAFLACRRSFTASSQLIRSIFEISWHKDDWIFVFNELHSYQLPGNRNVDHSQTGEVYISQFTNLIHLVTVDAGAVRTITLTKMRGPQGVMRGSVLTQSDRGLFFQPAISPIFLQKLPDYEAGKHASLVGPVRDEDPEYRSLLSKLESIEKDVMFVAGSEV